MRGIRVWARLLGIQRAVVEDVQVGDEGEIVVAVRPVWRERERCGVCRRRSPGYDLGDGRRRWRALDLGTTLAFVEGDAPRVRCRRHGVVVCAVPWARHGSRFTRAFEDQAAWLAVNTSKSAVAELMRVAWRTVGAICERVCGEAQREVDLLDGLRRIGIDEISHRKGQRYLTVVVDHHTGRLVWAAAGRDRKTVEAFFDALGERRCKQIELVSCDMAGWIAGPVADRLPDAVRCVDPFHVVMLATDALDEVRREVWNEARKGGEIAAAKDLKGARYALWKNPENLTDRQAAKLASIQKTNARLYRAYLLKEQLRQIYRLPAEAAVALLDEWIAWARRCRLPSFVKLARTITAQRFAKAEQLMNYIGLVPSEATTGQKRRLGAITKTGCGHARRLLVEAAWHYRPRPRIGKALADRHDGQPAEAIAVAWSAQQRLHRTWTRLEQRAKRRTIIAVAVARELTGFCWAVTRIE